jgi:hypothetical protein
MSVTIAHPTVDALLRQRGQVKVGHGQTSDLLIPLDRQPALSGEDCNEFRACFSHASFRKVARELVLRKQVEASVLRGIAGQKVEDYLGFLSRIGVASFDSATATLVRQIDNIGHTTEWYVSDLLDVSLGN